MYIKKITLYSLYDRRTFLLAPSRDSFSPSTGGFSAVQSTPAAGTLAGSGGSVGAGGVSFISDWYFIDILFSIHVHITG